MPREILQQTGALKRIDFGNLKRNPIFEAIDGLKTDEEIRQFLEDYIQYRNESGSKTRADILWALGYYGRTVNDREVNETKDKWLKALSSSQSWQVISKL